MVYDAALKVIDGFHEGRSSIGHNSNVMVSSSFSTPPPAVVSLMRSTSHSPSRNNTSSKSSKKPVKRPAPYAKNKSVLARRKEASSSMPKVPSELWMAPIPTPPPQIMIQSPTNVMKKPTYGQDPMPAILGLATHQSWKPNNVSTFIIKMQQKIQI